MIRHLVILLIVSTLMLLSCKKDLPPQAPNFSPYSKASTSKPPEDSSPVSDPDAEPSPESPVVEAPSVSPAPSQKPAPKPTGYWCDKYKPGVKFPYCASDATDAKNGVKDGWGYENGESCVVKGGMADVDSSCLL
jgi:hypothetical protein